MERKKLAAVVLIAAAAVFFLQPFFRFAVSGGKIDDWQYPGIADTAAEMAKSIGGAAGGGPSLFATSTASSMMDGSLGFSVGGSKDINNFRENVANGYLPIPTDVTYEGLFYDYYFDTGKTEECGELFCPAGRWIGLCLPLPGLSR